MNRIQGVIHTLIYLGATYNSIENALLNYDNINTPLAGDNKNAIEKKQADIQGYVNYILNDNIITWHELESVNLLVESENLQQYLIQDIKIDSFIDMISFNLWKKYISTFHTSISITNNDTKESLKFGSFWELNLSELQELEDFLYTSAFGSLAVEITKEEREFVVH